MTTETETEQGVQLVCPNCGSDSIGTREQAEIWQPANFTRLPESNRGDEWPGHEDGEGRFVDVEWDAYDSDDVGDTETIGYFCKACVWTWDGAATIPFVTREQFEASLPLERGWLNWRCRDIGYGSEEGEGNYIRRLDPDAWGKSRYEPVGGGPSLYLFTDEVVEWVPSDA